MNKFMFLAGVAALGFSVPAFATDGNNGNGNGGCGVGQQTNGCGETPPPVVIVGPAGPQGPAGPAGPQGETGPMGPAGPQGETGATGATGPQGPAGPMGPMGPTGKDGRDGLNGKDGLNGIDGRNGVDGKNGKDGLSAYEIAKLNGFTGTQVEWLNSLKANDRNYINEQIASVRFDLREMRKDMNGAVAGALAISGIPQVIEQDGGMIGGAVGHYNGETSFAIGVSKSKDNMVFKAGASVNTRGSAGGHVGVGFGF
jgi:hypothetical protein